MSDRSSATFPPLARPRACPRDRAGSGQWAWLQNADSAAAEDLIVDGLQPHLLPTFPVSLPSRASSPRLQRATDEPCRPWILAVTVALSAVCTPYAHRLRRTFRSSIGPFSLDQGIARSSGLCGNDTMGATVSEPRSGMLQETPNTS